MDFNCHMLTLAREAAGLTQGAIAQYANVSQSLMSKIENGFESPSPQFLEKAAHICNVPIEFFEQQDAVPSDTVYDIFHKKRLTLPQKPLKQANANVQKLRMETARLLRSIDIPTKWPFPNISLDTHESPAEIAALTRATWRVPTGPLPHLVQVVEEAGTPILLADLGHEKLRAMSMAGIKGDNAHIIAINSRLPASAQRFALAHEIGHLVMHDGVSTSDMEKEADSFASALLMPATDIAPQLRNVRFRDLGELKRRWRVSLGALIYRANSLGLITPRHYRTLNMDLNKLPNGRKREPGEFQPEEPRLIRDVIGAYRKEYDYSVEQLCKLMVVTRQRFCEQYDPDTPLSDSTRLRLLEAPPLALGPSQTDY
jgi:Zn-dependent peptidase ImmA (M78 family)/DNA-binding XRE family transcriptional regulator